MRCGRPRIAPAIRGLATAGSGAAKPNPSDGVAAQVHSLVSPGERAVRSRNGVGGLPRRFRARFAAAALPLLLAACAATETPESVQPDAPGFLLGVWHGFIFPVAWIVSLFSDNVAIYAVPNNGGWYDLGFVIGIMVFGVGAKGGHTFAVHKR